LAVVSTLVQNILRHEGSRAYLQTVMSGTMNSFVADLCITTLSPEDTEGNVALGMQQALDLWEEAFEL
jgi:hypothetical protein